MTALDGTPSLQEALWSVPLCLAVHNLEEALGVRKVARRPHYGSGLASFSQSQFWQNPPEGFHGTPHPPT